MDINKLGRYDIVRVLGKGAMGVVYEGRDPNLDRPVAIKTIRVQSLSAQAAIEYDGRFRIEARSAARLHHPNIVSVFDSGQDGDTSYLVMELIQGEDLKHHLECGARFSTRAAIAMVHDLLMALDHAHRQNVVHRDIKPANMLIEASGRVKLTDFGVARIQEPDETNLTQVGGAVGTPKYMSPEQAKGLRGDSRSDVFSAAVVLYELLTSRLPFDGDNQFVVIHQIVSTEATPPSSLNPDVPLAMDAVIARAMAKNPDERYATARDFALALRAVAQQQGPASQAPIADVADEMDMLPAHRNAFSDSSEDRASPNPALRDGSSTGIFGPAGDISLLSTVSHDAEYQAWSVVKDSTRPQDFLGFLERFPSGIYARRAQQRMDRLPAAVVADPDVTISHFESPLPVADSLGLRRKWLVAALAAFLCGTVAVVRFTRPSPPTEQPRALAKPEPIEEFIVADTPSSKSLSIPPVAPAIVASKPAVALSIQSAIAARTAPSAPSRPKVVAEVVVVHPEPSQSVRPAVAQEPAPVPESERMQGPSMPGQACGDRVFMFRIACVAEQCQSDRYRLSQECVQFKQMENAREEQRNSRR